MSDQRDVGLAERCGRAVAGTPLEGMARTVVRRLRDFLARAAAAAGFDTPALPMFAEPGHYYSPVPSHQDIAEYERSILGVPSSIPEIDLRLPDQLALLAELKRFSDEQPFGERPEGGLRFGLDNDSLGYSDALALYSLLRHLRPRRIVEVGSGWSSCLILDTCERYLDGDPEITIIDPYPERLRGLVTRQDLSRVQLLEMPVQHVPIARFEALEPGDVLFIDSTHVGKLGSDVNHELFVVLPALRAGVHVHFHDIFFPFDYPVEWLREGRAWNEAYLLRAFLQYNDAFVIELFNDLVHRCYPDLMRRELPLWCRNPGGSLWLRKARDT